ncbi:MAG: hypothetical protein SH856_14600 [Flavobacteriales bacterium]|nr:hypothetical protein [Flavobacteriales bacterium]
MVKRFRKIENLHILFWLVKDSCWLMDYKWQGIVMIAPTLIVAVWLTWKFRSSASELAHNIAVTMWICANSTWMIGEFYFDDASRPIAVLFFATGLLSLAAWYMPLAAKFLAGKKTST